MITDVFTAVSAHAELTGVTCVLGAEFVDEMATPNRIVWAPTQDSFEPGKRINTPAQSPLLTPPRVVNSIGTRWAGVRARVWAEGNGTPASDIAAVEDLVRKMLVAVHESTFGSYRVNGLTWLSGEELVQQGRACDVSLAFAIPIYKTAAASGTTTAPLAVINTSGMEGTLRLPTGDITAVPSP